jgi:hypothetical protein
MRPVVPDARRGEVSQNGRCLSALKLCRSYALQKIKCLVQAWRFGNVDDHAISAAREENAVAIETQLVGVMHSFARLGESVPTISRPGEVFSPTDYGKVQFKSLARKLGSNSIKAATGLGTGRGAVEPRPFSEVCGVEEAIEDSKLGEYQRFGESQ